MMFVNDKGKRVRKQFFAKTVGYGRGPGLGFNLIRQFSRWGHITGVSIGFSHAAGFGNVP